EKGATSQIRTACSTEAPDCRLCHGIRQCELNGCPRTGSGGAEAGGDCTSAPGGSTCKIRQPRDQAPRPLKNHPLRKAILDILHRAKCSLVPFLRSGPLGRRTGSHSQSANL